MGNTPSAGTQTKLRLLDQLRDKIRFKHYSIRTEQAYLDWIRRFILFHAKRHPAEMGAPEVESNKRTIKGRPLCSYLPAYKNGRPFYRSFYSFYSLGLLSEQLLRWTPLSRPRLVKNKLKSGPI